MQLISNRWGIGDECQSKGGKNKDSCGPVAEEICELALFRDQEQSGKCSKGNEVSQGCGENNE